MRLFVMFHPRMPFPTQFWWRQYLSTIRVWQNNFSLLALLSRNPVITFLRWTRGGTMIRVSINFSLLNDAIWQCLPPKMWILPRMINNFHSLHFSPNFFAIIQCFFLAEKLTGARISIYWHSHMTHNRTLLSCMYFWIISTDMCYHFLFTFLLLPLHGETLGRQPMGFCSRNIQIWMSLPRVSPENSMSDARFLNRNVKPIYHITFEIIQSKVQWKFSF